MSVKTQKDLTPAQKQSWLKAVSAMELKNYAYTVRLTQGLLKTLPEFLDARKLARHAAFERQNTTKKGMLSGLQGFSSSLAIARAKSLLKKKDLPGALIALEEILGSAPDNGPANRLMFEVAMQWQPPLREVALLALETLANANPSDIKSKLELAAFCLLRDESGQPWDPARAIDVYNRVLAISPNDLPAIKGVKDASAALSVKKGGWEIADSYRELIKDKEGAISLEQQGRVVKSEEMIDHQLAETIAEVQLHPQRIDLAKRAADLYEKKGDFENAIEWYRYAEGVAGGGDPTLARKISDLQLRQIEVALKARQDFVETHPENPESEGYRGEIAQLIEQRAHFITAEAQGRVDRNPTDLIAHFELGDALMKSGQHQTAITHLQRARMNPSMRLKAMSLLGQCYVARGMNDLAAKTFGDAIAELTSMDAVKKDLLYNLGLVYEAMGQREKSVDCMKSIYEVDYGYRDVAQRVEQSYDSGHATK